VDLKLINNLLLFLWVEHRLETAVTAG
jgi:hypothetical protein